MIISLLSIIGFGAGVNEWSKGAYLVGFFATSTCSLAFLVNLI